MIASVPLSRLPIARPRICLNVLLSNLKTLLSRVMGNRPQKKSWKFQISLLWLNEGLSPLFWFCRTWTKRFLITSQTRVKRVSRIHHRTILFHSPFILFHSFQPLSFSPLSYFLSFSIQKLSPLTDLQNWTRVTQHSPVPIRFSTFPTHQSLNF